MLTSQRTVVLYLMTAAALLLSYTDATAQSRRRARLSEDIQQRLQAGDPANTGADTSVIVTGSQARIDQVAARHGLRVRKRLETGAVLEVPAGRLAQLADDGDLDQMSGNYRLRAHMAVTTQAIGADQVWAGDPSTSLPSTSLRTSPSASLRAGPSASLRASGYTGQGIVVAVLDTGVAAVPELRGRILANVDFTLRDGSGQASPRGKALDENGHGTHVAGIIAASGRNARGVAPGASIVNLKVLNAQGEGDAADVVEAIDWAVKHRRQYRIRVLNLSLGGPVLQSYRDDPINQAVERAYRAGLFVVASAGNFGKLADGTQVLGGITVPGNSPYAFTVAALNTKQTAWRSDDSVATYSSKGFTHLDRLVKPDISAPGNRIRGLLVTC